MTNQILPVLPLRDIVVFPQMIVPLFVGRDKSVKALEAVMHGDKTVFLLSQRNPADEDPGADDLFDVGTVATVLQLLKLPDGTVKVLVEGQSRARLGSLGADGEYLSATIVAVEDVVGDATQVEALVRSSAKQFEAYVKLNKKTAPEIAAQIGQIDDAGRFADTVAANLNLKVAEKQSILAEADVAKRLELVFGFMEGEMGVMQVEKKIRSRVKRQMEKTQREYYLNEQMKAIQKELGEGEEAKDEVTEIEEKIARARLPKEARERAISELKKLKAMAPQSAEATVVRNYLDVLLGLPWNKKSKIKKDIALAQKVLDDDHFGLEKVKDRIIEYLGVQVRTNKLKGPILCLVGPPGVGKTSLGRSIAKATGREFIRQSLGGVRDEAEIRGHRRTYIGSLPGKVIQNLKKAGTSNPLFLLDEIDKLGQDFRGDPSSALLEVLDPEQNKAFNDHYLEIDYDLSDVMFVTTANSLNMPQPLLDRMEIINLSGYTEDEKVEIAKRHLLTKQYEAHGLKAEEFAVTDGALRDLIRYYTREAGVRTLERELAKLARKSLRRILEGKATDGHGRQRQPPRVRGRAEVPLRRWRGRGPDRGRDRPGLDRGRRRTADHRGGHRARQGQHQDDRQAGRRDDRIDLGGAVVHQGPCGAVRHQAVDLRAQGHPRPRSRGRDAQGRAVGGRRDGHRDRLDADRHPGPQGRGDDRRGDAARPRAADRRVEGEAAGGAQGRHHHGVHPGREREGPGRHPGERHRRAADHPRRPRRSGAGGGADHAAGADRLGRAGGAGGAARRGGGGGGGGPALRRAESL